MTILVPLRLLLGGVALVFLAATAMGSIYCGYQVGAQQSAEVAYAATYGMVVVNVAKWFALATLLLVAQPTVRWLAIATAILCATFTGAAFWAWSVNGARPLMHPFDEMLGLSAGASNSFMLILAAFMAEAFPILCRTVLSGFEDPPRLQSA